LYRALKTWAWICAPALAACTHARVSYGPIAELPLVHVSTDTSRWYTPVATPAGTEVLFIDTGYSRSACDDDLLPLLGLTPHGRAHIRGEVGWITASKGTLGELDLGGHRLTHLRCEVRDLGATSSILDPVEVPVAGVLGIDVLKRFLVEIDPENAVLRLSDPRGTTLRHEPGAIRLRREAGIGPRRELPVFLDGKRIWGVLDTGADRTYVRGQAADLEAAEVRQGVVVRGTGVDGATTRTLVYYSVGDVKVGDVALGGQELIGRPRPWWSDGLVGIDVIGHLHGWYDLRRPTAVLHQAGQALIPMFSPTTAPPVAALPAP
jgi:hypothetical protein